MMDTQDLALAHVHRACKSIKTTILNSLEGWSVNLTPQQLQSIADRTEHFITEAVHEAWEESSAQPHG